MSVEVIQPGVCTTVQDLGRYGFQQHGVIVGGAMDSFATRVANLLAGNQGGEAVLELTLKGPALLFHEDLVIAICGGDMAPVLDGKRVDRNRPIWVKRGSTLQFSHAKKGCRTYLAVAGGWDVPVIMGSRSTNFRAGFGGVEGRLLQPKDRLKTNEPGEFSRFLASAFSEQAGANSSVQADWYVPKATFTYGANPVVRVIRGEHYDDFSSLSRQSFWEEDFRVTPQSDRMGYRLEGPQLTLSSPLEITSEAVTAGTIQVPPSGQPIVLLADRQTTGGYPKIGYVASVDLPVFAQLKPGDRVRFQEVSVGDAQRALWERDSELKQLRVAMELISGWRQR
ncbi:biotin-dependent carboxyltransferase family protein [Brevibacillus choshinensis]|uniref:Biotin-dependent carboxyltransferase family protein n=1 Tax=Brevibacillus choshinensis TaxID=54911 RepID=A0ABX7FWF2_BRECH|nr:biotin-dependent carboxyltransferase family protein [Brevibacillus choshinensis]QRG70092.1 biotin-dependent carboxyltransferase family protein [Brevibacillus choshinensis]